MNLASVRILCLLAAVMMANAGCGPGERSPENPVSVTKTTGVLNLDGEPGYGVRIYLLPVDGSVETNPVGTKGFVKEDGSFELATYTADDGAPPGEYILAFERFSTEIRLGGGPKPDLFEGAYLEGSDHKLTIPDSDEPFDAGTIELTSP